MDIQFLNKDEQKPIQYCKSCGSVFILDDSCEACGYQFNLDRLGDGLDEKSFFVIKEMFDYTFLNRYKREKRERYKRNLVSRYLVLLDFFINKAYSPKNHESVYRVELKELIEELVKIGISKQELENHLSFFETDDMFISQIHDWIVVSSEKDSKMGIYALINFKLLGAIPFMRIVLTSAILLVAMILLSILIFGK